MLSFFSEIISVSRIWKLFLWILRCRNCISFSRIMTPTYLFYFSTNVKWILGGNNYSYNIQNIYVVSIFLHIQMVFISKALKTLLFSKFNRSFPKLNTGNIPLFSVKLFFYSWIFHSSILENIGTVVLF